MKKSNLIYWFVAVCLIVVTGFTAIHVHNADQKNAVKMAKEAKASSLVAKKEKKLNKEIKSRMRNPISWTKSSLTGDYPNVNLKKYKNTKKHKKRLWVEVSTKKQRVYIKSGTYTLYTMYASVAKNYDKGQDQYQKTPNGVFIIDKKRGSSYFDATRGYGALYWTAFAGKGLYRFESVPVNEDGNVIEKLAQQLGKKVTKKNNVNAYGSIRLSIADAKWFEENISAGTRVVIHTNDSNEDDLNNFDN